MTSVALGLRARWCHRPRHPASLPICVPSVGRLPPPVRAGSLRRQPRGSATVGARNPQTRKISSRKSRDLPDTQAQTPQICCITSRCCGTNTGGACQHAVRMKTHAALIWKLAVQQVCPGAQRRRLTDTGSDSIRCTSKFLTVQKMHEFPGFTKKPGYTLESVLKNKG